jgi:murein DD-endopeptidase MepM/ murein hydrolase activator NlpD
MPRRVFVAVLAASAIAISGAVPALAAWPVATRSSYVSQYAHRGHVAIDITAPRWTRIIPIRSGRVVFAGWRSNCGGYQVWVSHGDGLYSAYYHLVKETAFRGEWVTGGSETIGFLGTSGCATGPHLHIEVWRGYPWRSGSYRVNPWNYVQSGYYLPYRYR